MTGPEAHASPFAGKRRQRPLLRRLFYREDAFDVLDPPELTALFEAFACVVRLHPVILYWVHRLDAREYLVSSFRHRSMVKYSELEVVHVTPDEIGYYRLPGARIGGGGRVEPGLYSLAIQGPGGRRHYLRIRKCDHGQLHLDEVCERPERDAASFQSFPRHTLDRSKFAAEMATLVERGLEWDYQRALLGEPDPFTEAEWGEMTRKCAGLSPRIDAFLAEIRRRDRSRRVST
ncbi:hypothetical protein OV203_26575 [Nannocystis sp. ILAH1]|uniref:hypothetical protein n=1 Tax=Nannocystis sp. ILAH1 TaxID=2996789 RepID=UPI0022715E1D|nr:hypothetical protein [Nannocystis sp. ILAH1]MCY0990738.1 hypothetical protein [Nannocystis sp. ILAH1]